MKHEKKPKESDVPTTNMWQEILRDAMTNKDLEESHLFIFGDKNVGKKSIIRVINKEYLQKFDYEEKKIFNIDENGGKYALIDYTFIHIKKLNELDNGKYSH
jgi:exonuclease III